MQMYGSTYSLDFAFLWQRQQGQASLPNGPRIVLGLLQKKFSRRKISMWIFLHTIENHLTFQIRNLWRHRWAKNMKWTREVGTGTSQRDVILTTSNILGNFFLFSISGLNPGASIHPQGTCVCIFFHLSAPWAKESDSNYVLLKIPLTQIWNSRALD